MSGVRQDKNLAIRLPDTPCLRMPAWWWWANEKGGGHTDTLAHAPGAINFSRTRPRGSLPAGPA